MIALLCVLWVVGLVAVGIGLGELIWRLWLK